MLIKTALTRFCDMTYYSDDLLKCLAYLLPAGDANHYRNFTGTTVCGTFVIGVFFCVSLDVGVPNLDDPNKSFDSAYGSESQKDGVTRGNLIFLLIIDQVHLHASMKYVRQIK